jgi:hypothetical protein
MVGAAGTAIIFVVLLLLTLVVTLFVMAYVARCMLVVMEATAAGNDEVVWPDEPYQDWLAGAAQLFGLLAIWIAPLGILYRILKSNGMENPLPPILAGGAVALWLTFPISLLSSQSASSRWVLLRLTVLRQILRLPGAFLIVYLVSGVFLALLLTLLYQTYLSGWSYLVLVTALVGATALFIYARLLGRLGWLIGEREQQRVQAVPRPQPKPESIAVEVQDPWSQPGRRRKKKTKTKTRLPPLPVEGYALADDPPASPPIETPLDGYNPIGEDPLPLKDEPAPGPLHQAEHDPRIVPSVLEQQLARPSKSKIALPPRRPMFDGVYNFPFYPACLGNWGALVLEFTILGALFLALQVYFPF